MRKLRSESRGLWKPLARQGAKIVWMPTTSSNYDYMHNTYKGGGISILSRAAKLLPQVGKILDIVKAYDLVVATGHLPVHEAFVLVEEAASRGITKIRGDARPGLES